MASRAIYCMGVMRATVILSDAVDGVEKQAAIAIGSLSHIYPGNTTYDVFAAHRQAAEDFLTAMEDAAQDIDAIIGPCEARYGEADDAVTAKIAAGERRYSTVTLLARLRGRSTSQPRSTAMW